MKLAQSRVTGRGQVSSPGRGATKARHRPWLGRRWDAEGELVVVRRVGTYTFVDVHAALFDTPPKSRTLRELKEEFAAT